MLTSFGNSVLLSWVNWWYASPNDFAKNRIILCLLVQPPGDPWIPGTLDSLLEIRIIKSRFCSKWNFSFDFFDIRKPHFIFMLDITIPHVMISQSDRSENTNHIPDNIQPITNRHTWGFRTGGLLCGAATSILFTFRFRHVWKNFQIDPVRKWSFWSEKIKNDFVWSVRMGFDSILLFDTGI